MERLGWLIIGLAVFQFACGETPHTALDDEDRTADATGLDPTMAIFESITHAARGLAIAVNHDPAVRRAIRDILRDSPWSGHRVTLDELVSADDGGAVILNAAARAVGESPRAFRDRLEDLPALDFLMPRGAHRRSWRATPGVRLVASLGSDSDQHLVLDTNGRAHSIESFDPDQVYFLLHPAEPRLKRYDPQPVGVGEVIQTEVDGTIGIARVADDGTLVYSTRASNSPRARPTSHHGTNWTYVDEIYSHRCDGTGDVVEIELRVDFYDEIDRELNSSTWRFDLECEEEGYLPHDTLIAEALPDSGVHYIHIHAWELDGGLHGDDDDFGSRDFFWSDRDQERSVPGTMNASINLTLGWTPRSPSVVTTVQVTPSFVELMDNSSDSRAVSARALDQYGYGLSGYSVSNWSVTSPSIASIYSEGPMEGRAYPDSPGSTSFSATVAGVTGWGTIQVNEPPPQCPPPEIICE